jgi:hypothetical protein
VWFGVTIMGVTPLRYEDPWIAYMASVWTIMNSLLIWLAVRRMIAREFAGERRRSVRWETELRGNLWGRPCRVDDLSLTGARLSFPDGCPPAARGRSTLDLDLGREIVRLHVNLATLWPGTHEREPACTVDFADGQVLERATIARALFSDAPYRDEQADVIRLPQRRALPAEDAERAAATG